jgi:dinuclear metal center YbgI/SA1388 family protein
LAQRDEIVAFLNDYLRASEVADYGPSGLQVSGSDEVSKVALGVSASAELFRLAKEADAQMILVHHGMFWDRDPRTIVGARYGRIRLLIEHGISLVGYHLPLDMHPESGNNAQIAQRLGLEHTEPFGEYEGSLIGIKGSFDAPLGRAELLSRCAGVFGVEPMVFGFGPEMIRSLGIVSGGGTELLPQAIDAGLDAFLTGEAKEPTQETCREAGINFIAVGHYNSEKFGVMALGDLLTREFGVDCEFVDVPNPI